MLSNIAAIWVQEALINDVIIEGQSERFTTILIQIAIAYLMYSVMFTIGPYVTNHTYTRLRKRLAIRLMDRMHKLPISDLQKERSANYVYHFSNDVEHSSYMIGQEIPQMVQQLIGIIVMVWIVAKASPIFVVIVLLFGIPFIALGKKFADPRKKASGEVNRTRSDLLVHLEEGISATREVLAFHRERWEEKRYQSFFDKYFKSSMKEAKVINKQILWSDPLRLGANIAVLFVGGWLVFEGRLLIGTYVVVFQLTSMILTTLSHLYNSIMQMYGKLASVERLRGVLDGQDIVEGTLSLEEPVRSLSFDHVAFQYLDKGNSILSDVSIEFPIGKKIALVGTSGGGKSTIASLLVRFFEPNSGHIWVNGKSLEQLKRPDWNSKISIVFQDPYLFPDTIRTNLLLGLTGISDEQMIEVCRAIRIHDVIDAFPEGYETVVGERGITLSGGQRQRLALARAMLYDPEILILDEATSALDMETERKIQHELDHLRKHKTTIIIAHRLSTIQNADIIYLLDRGIVAEQGTHVQLMEKTSIYRRLVLSQDFEHQGSEKKAM